MPFVLDHSMVSGWFLENQATRSTQAIAERLAGDTAVTPALWELELNYVLRTACLRQRTTAQQAQEVLQRLAMPPIEVARQPVPRSELLALALRFGLSS